MTKALDFSKRHAADCDEGHGPCYAHPAAETHAAELARQRRNRDKLSAMAARFLVDERFELGLVLELPERAAHHALRVLRLRDGDAVELFDGHGGVCAARLVVRGRDALAAVEQILPAEPEAVLHIALAQCISSSDKMDWTIEKAVELGATAILPLQSERATARLDAERAQRKHAHWHEIVVAACMQCGRSRLPSLAPVVPLAALLRAPATAEHRLMLSPRGVRSLRELAPAPRAVLLLVGPEAGLSDDEERAARSAGFDPIRLGPRVLRTETAGAAAIAAIQALYGDF